MRAYFYIFFILIIIGIFCKDEKPPADNDLEDELKAVDIIEKDKIEEEEIFKDIEEEEDGIEDKDVPYTGGPLYPCSDNSQCIVGFCVETSKESVCTKTCMEDGDCWGGWSCKMVLNTLGDPTYICVPNNIYICKPCVENKDCISPLITKNDKCVSYGADGSFCGVECDKEKECPDGYQCKNIVSVDGKESMQCVPSEGECVCTEKYIKTGFFTTCYNHNEWGTCWGKRTCAEKGLTECDAKKPAEEKCNKEDDNCDGKVDPPSSKGCIKYYQDIDLDGYGMGVGNCLCESPGEGYSMLAGDCNDVNSGVNPLAIEICNGIDDNCDGEIDGENSKNCKEFFFDEDGDGFPLNFDDKKCLCNPEPPYSGEKKKIDCNDKNLDVYPGADEVCNEIDDNCDELIDVEDSKGCNPFYYDGDKDGYGVSNKFKCLCGPKDEYSTKKAGDCNDDDKSINPLGKEICNGMDDNCNGKVDEGDLVELCGTPKNAIAKCKDKCVIEKCVEDWFDVNQDFLDGCECKTDSFEKENNNICSNAKDLGIFPDGGFKSIVSGHNLVPSNDEDWFKLTANDNNWNAEPNGCDTFNLRIHFTKNPDNEFFYDIYRGSCAEVNNICKEAREANWATNFYKDLNPQKSGNEGECACSPKKFSADDIKPDINGKLPPCFPDCMAEPDKNLCSDNTAVFYIRVYRDKSKKGSCNEYELEISNGVYKFPP